MSCQYRRACNTLNEFADDIIAKALSRSASISEDNTAGKDERASLIESLLSDLQDDTVAVRKVVMDLFIAGQNMTGTMAAWLLAQLEANPDVFQRIRSEILDTFGPEDAPRAPLTWDNLKSCKSLQHAILETLRMYPLLPNIGRNAKCDTTLPYGGGADGSEPIAVPKGAFVTVNTYLMHRRAEDWGSDGWEFNPDRWKGRKYGPEYAPFGAGPRVCVRSCIALRLLDLADGEQVGQAVAKAEISYMVARLMQRYSEIQAPSGQHNLTKGYKAIVAPKYGVKLCLREARRP